MGADPCIVTHTEFDVQTKRWSAHYDVQFTFISTNEYIHIARVDIKKIKQQLSNELQFHMHPHNR